MVQRRTCAQGLAQEKKGAALKRGEVWVTNMNPARGSEIGKIRPGLILQADWLTSQGSANIVVVPLSSQVRPATAHLRPILKAREGLRQDSQVLVDQPRTIDRRRFGQGPLLQLSPAEMARVEECLLVALGMPEKLSLPFKH
jgi:mRNA interferase MazF